MKQYTEQELSRLLETVEEEFTGFLTKSEATDSVAAPLAKSADDKPSERSERKDKNPSDSKEEKGFEQKSKDPREEKDPSQANDSKAPESKEKHDDAAELKSQSPAKDAGESHSDKHREPTADANDHCDYDDEDHAHMHKMYRSMSRGELKTHHDSVRQALDSHGMEKCGDMSMGKSEDAAKATEVKAETIVLPNQEVELLKSELSAEKAKAADLKKNFDAVQEFLTKLVKKSAPQGKAITELSVIAKSEGAPEDKQLSKSEINEVLMRKASDSKLSKNDREAINAYYLNGSNFNTISHLLKN